MDVAVYRMLAEAYISVDLYDFLKCLLGNRGGSRKFPTVASEFPDMLFGRYSGRLVTRVVATSGLEILITGVVFLGVWVE